MPYNKRMRARIAIILLTLTLVIAAVPLVNAASMITLTPSSQSAGASVTVEGTSFGANKAVGIGFGAEAAVPSEVIVQTGSGTGPYTGILANRPIKPGTVRFTIDVADGLVTYVVTDSGNGALTSTSPYFGNGTLNYVTGQYTRYATSDPGSYTIVVTAAYTRYQYSATPAAGVNTSASGTFSASFSVPAVTNGTYAVTAVDAQGNLASSILGVGVAIPEGLSIGAVALLSSLILIVGSRFLRKKSNTQKCGSLKTIK